MDILHEGWVWAAVSAGAAALSCIAAAAMAWMSFTERRERRAEKEMPLIQAIAGRNEHGVFILNISVQNRAPYNIGVRSVRIRRPKGCTLARIRNGVTGEAAHIAAPNLALMAAGAPDHSDRSTLVFSVGFGNSQPSGTSISTSIEIPRFLANARTLIAKQKVQVINAAPISPATTATENI